MFTPLLKRVPTTWARISADTIGLADRVRRARCGLMGHAMVLHLQPQKMSLRCMDCGEQTPGWTIRARS